MKQEDKPFRGTQGHPQARSIQRFLRTGASPGRGTLTARIGAAGVGSASAPVQRQRDPAVEALQMKWRAETERWMPTAMRPDIYPAPVQRVASAEKSSREELPSDGGGKAMPAAVQAKMEGAFGADFSAVRIHEGPRSEALGARAYTQGTDVHFAPGEYQPESQSGQELLGHELTHVVQQSQGRVKATTQAKGEGVNDDVGLEAEADAMGIKAARGEKVSGVGGSGKSAENLSGQTGQPAQIGSSVQMSKDPPTTNGGGANANTNSNNNSNSNNPYTAPFRDRKPAQSYLLEVMVDQPGAGGDRDTYEGSPFTEVDVGHTFVRLTKSNQDGSNVSRTYGFYPATPVNPILGPIEVAGSLNNDAGHSFEVRSSSTVAEPDFEKALTYIEQNSGNNYNLNTYNCTDFALGVASAAGISLPDTPGTWPGGGGSNPGDLGEDIRQQQQGGN